MLSIIIIPVYAEDEFDTSSFKYYDKAKELNYGEDPLAYEEIYYHYTDENSEDPDWTFVECITDYTLWDLQFGVAIEDILIYNYDTGSISDSHYLVYVTALEKFLRVDSRDIDKILEYCPDFVETMKEQKLCALRGDINDDFKVDIIDATYIQRYIAEYDDTVYVRLRIHDDYRVHLRIEERFIVTYLHADQYVTGEEKYHIGDSNHDGEVTILDATAIQRKLAKIEAE